jgi:hypothetical protein
MWVFIAIVAVIGLTFGSVIQGWILQIAFKIATKEAPAFGEAFKTCFLAIIVNFLIGLGLMQSGMDLVLVEILGVCVGIIVYTIAISMFLAAELKQALIVSIIMAVIGWLLMFLLQLATAGINDPGVVGG